MEPPSSSAQKYMKENDVLMKQDEQHSPISMDEDSFTSIASSNHNEHEMKDEQNKNDESQEIKHSFTHSSGIAYNSRHLSSKSDNRSNCCFNSESFCRNNHPPSCSSHTLPRSREGNLENETPILHRTDDSVMKSFAARNLRSMKEGSYSDSKDQTGSFISEYNSQLSIETSGSSFPEESNYMKRLSYKTSMNDKSELSCDKESKNYKRSIYDENPVHTNNSSKWSMASIEKRRGLNSELEDSFNAFFKPFHSMVGSTEIEYSSDFSKRDQFFDSTRLSIDFGTSQFSMDSGPELKDLSKLSGLSRIVLQPISTENISNRSKSATGSDLVSNSSLARKDKSKASASGPVIHRKLRRPGLRRVLSDSFDRCLQSSESNRSLSRKRLVCGKSKSVDSETGFNEDGCIPIKRSILFDSNHHNLIRHTGLTPEISRISVSDNISEKPAKRPCLGFSKRNLLRNTPETENEHFQPQNILCDNTGENITSEKNSFAKFYHQNDDNHAILKPEINALDLCTLPSFKQGYSTVDHDEHQCIVDSTEEKISNNAEKISKSSLCDFDPESNEDLPACRLSLDTLAVQNEQVPQKCFDSHCFSFIPDDLKEKEMKFLSTATSSGPILASSPAPGSQPQATCVADLKPLIFKKGVSSLNSSFDSDTCLNTTIETETNEPFTNPSPGNIFTKRRRHSSGSSVSSYDIENKKKRLSLSPIEFYRRRRSSTNSYSPLLEIDKQKVSNFDREQNLKFNTLANMSPLVTKGHLASKHALSSIIEGQTLDSGKDCTFIKPFQLKEVSVKTK